MKKKLTKNVYLQSVISLCILVVFAYMALSYGGSSQQKSRLPDGRWEIAKYFSNGRSEVTTGNVDANGLWEGMVTVKFENEHNELTSTLEVKMEAGLKQGTGKIIRPNGSVEYWCYEDDEPIHEGKCEKSAQIEIIDNTAYELFAYNEPWYKVGLITFGFNETYIESYLDTLEQLLYENELSEEDFDDYYEDVIGVLEETPYDSIIQINNEAIIHNGLNLILRNEFRLATFDSYLRGDSSTYNVVKTKYPNYIQLLSLFEVTDSDFEKFCHVYDSIMGTYSYVALTDTFIIDTLDYRMYRALDFIGSSDDSNSLTKSLLKNSIVNFAAEPDHVYKNLLFILNEVKENPPSDVSTVVFTTFLIKFIEGDVIKNSVFEAFSLKKGIARLPVLSIRISNTSTTECTLTGNVIDDGGAEVTERGIVWATFYNPTTEDNIKTSGSGEGYFSVTLSGLSTGTTYYARPYAINSAGIAFGNCIEFTPGVTAIEEINNPDMDFTVYPNPVTQGIKVDFCLETAEIVELMLVNIQGQIIFHNEYHGLMPGQNQIEIDLSEFKDGIYNCRIFTERGINSKQIIIAK